MKISELHHRDDFDARRKMLSAVDDTRDSGCSILTREKSLAWHSGFQKTFEFMPTRCEIAVAIPIQSLDHI